MKNLFTKTVIVSLLYGYSVIATAEFTLYEQDDFKLSASFNAAVGAYFTKNTSFGAGRIDYFSGDNTGDATWGEGFLKPAVFADYKLTNAGHIYGGLSAVGTATFGNGDAGGYTKAGEDIAAELRYVGWKSV